MFDLIELTSFEFDINYSYQLIQHLVASLFLVYFAAS